MLRMSTIKFVSHGSVLSVRISSIYAIRIYGTTIEVYYGFKECISLPFKGNEESVETLREIFGV
jgi:hypothetical protein